MIVNLTPHPIRIYPSDCPDRIDPATVEPLLTIPPSPNHPTARIGETPLGTVEHIAVEDWATTDLRVPVEYVEYTAHSGTVHPLPPVDTDEQGRPQVWYVVALVVAVQQTYTGYARPDLLVPYREVRNPAGTVIGCRQLARPV